MAAPAAHELLRLESGATLLDAAGNGQTVPLWAERALVRHPWVVVRRDARPPGRLPVGVRGPMRQQRHGAWIDAADILERVAPEDLVASARRRRFGGRWVAILADVAPVIGACGLVWGPVGSVGFELATGAAATTAASDLDLLVRAPSPIRERGAPLVVPLSGVGRRHGCRVDCLIETPTGGVHLRDLWARGPVLARTDAGPLLVADPWQPFGTDADPGRES